MDVRLPDGTVIQGVPDGTTRADLVTKLKANGMPVPADWLQPTQQPSLAERVGGSIAEVPRQIGLTTRYALEAAGNTVGTLSDPIANFVVNPIARLANSSGAAPAGAAASRLADWLNLPQPANADERVIGDMTRTGFSALGMSGAAKAAAGALTGVSAKVAQALAANPGQQTAAAVTAGGAGGAAREAGASPAVQAGAALVGGVAGGIGAAKAQDAAGALKGLLMPSTSQAALQAADQQINLTLQRQGIDWSQVPERIRQSMREDAAQALSRGASLNGDALQRLLVMRRAGVTPTVGMLTQDPGQITREMNLAKTGANSTDTGLQRLPALQNSNTRALLDNLDRAGADGAPNAYEAGRQAIGSLQQTVTGEQGRINSLYQAARDSQGRSLPLEGGTFTKRANELLDEANVGSFLPHDIAGKMNAIALGKIPLTVDAAEQLKTSIGNLQRGSSDGNVRRALGLVRQALDDAPLQGSPQVNPGNLPAVPGTVPPTATQAGQQSIDAFNAARTANRAWMQRIEANPALKAVVDGVEPDQFVQKFIVGKGASAADVQGLREALAGQVNTPAAAGQAANNAPQGLDAIRQYLVKYLKDAATSGDSDVTKFAGSGYRAALRNIGDEKLSVFFKPDELQHLHDLGDAAKYMQAQPAGSAVNNSNSGALLIGKGLDMLSSFSSKLPLGLKDTITGTIQGVRQSQALKPANALSALYPDETIPRLNPLLAAALAAPTAVQGRQNDGR